MGELCSPSKLTCWGPDAWYSEHDCVWRQCFYCFAVAWMWLYHPKLHVLKPQSPGWQHWEGPCIFRKWGLGELLRSKVLCPWRGLQNLDSFFFLAFWLMIIVFLSAVCFCHDVPSWPEAQSYGAPWFRARTSRTVSQINPFLFISSLPHCGIVIETDHTVFKKITKVTWVHVGESNRTDVLITRYQMEEKWPL